MLNNSSRAGFCSRWNSQKKEKGFSVCASLVVSCLSPYHRGSIFILIIVSIAIEDNMSEEGGRSSPSK